jgi:hypothetical protein
MGNAPVVIEPDASGAIECQSLGLTLRLAGGNLVIADRDSGEILQTDAEAFAAEAAANNKRAAEAERRAAEAEEANRKLRESLQSRGIDPDFKQ